MKLLLSVSLVLISFSVLSQTPKEIEQKKFAIRQATLNAGTEKIETLSLNLIGVPKNNQGALKDDFLDYKKKIISLNYDEYKEFMTITYFGLPQEKILYVLKVNGVNSSAIIKK